jgi:predicted AlkP superfamily phosphohydrolase/phosphomutase
LPISYPLLFSSWLARRQGSYGTLGLLEDTWGRNELALDDRRFLDQAWLSHEERKKMFFETLGRTREGVCICVFDASDRIQHMFWRYIDPKHPAPQEDQESFKDTIPEMYRRMDVLVGETMDQLADQDLLMILSDHGFSSFRRCVNLNTWLYENGYLATKDNKQPEGRDYLQEVDWSRTKAFALGLSGLYVNRKGRERFGIVSDQEAEVVKKEIIDKLTGLKDPQDGSTAIKRVYDTRKAYKGLYTDEAPDLIVGYYPGYRVSWDSITGTIEPQVFSDNVKAWSGDHHVDPEEVPGILLVNRPLTAPAPNIIDIAPTTLALFGITPPSYMEGRVIV